MYRGSMPPDSPISLGRRCSFRNSVSIHPRSALGTCSSTAREVGPSDALPSSFESQELCGLEATGSVSDYESISVSSQIDDTQTTSPSQTRGNFYRVFQKFVPIVNCILRKAFNASLGKCKLIQVRNLSK